MSLSTKVKELPDGEIESSCGKTLVEIKYHKCDLPYYLIIGKYYCDEQKTIQKCHHEILFLDFYINIFECRGWCSSPTALLHLWFADEEIKGGKLQKDYRKKRKPMQQSDKENEHQPSNILNELQQMLNMPVILKKLTKIEDMSHARLVYSELYNSIGYQCIESRINPYR